MASLPSEAASEAPSAELRSAGQPSDPGEEETRLRQQLERDPGAVEAWVELAKVLYLSNRFSEAIHCLQRALDLDPQHRLALNRLGAALQHQGQLESAREVLQRAVGCHPDDGDAWCNLGVVNLLTGDAVSLAAARQALERALEIAPEHRLALRAQVRTLRELGERKAALPPLCRLVALEPQRWPELLNLGDELQNHGDLSAAQHAYETALEHAASSPGPVQANGSPPLLALLHANRGAALINQEDYVRGRDAIEQALRIHPPFAEAEARLAQALRHLGHARESLEASERALRLDPQLSDAHAARGLALQVLGRPSEALEAMQKALRAQPSLAERHGDLGLCLQDLGRTTEALAQFEEALALDNTLAGVRLNRGLSRLLVSESQQGWDDYEARHRGPTPALICRPPGRRWQGEDLAGAPLLLVGEQGHGDMIQFLRYAPLLRQRCGTLALCLPPNLLSLAETAGLADAVWTSEQAMQHGGPWLPLLSVCLALATTPQQLKADPTWLKVPEERVNRWRPHIRTDGTPVIGLHWQGNPISETGSGFGRSLPLQRLAPLSRCGPMHLVSLQKGPGSEQVLRCSFADRFIARQDLVDTAWDFVDTAAILQCCDLVITSDSALAHLAGSMGLPVWLLLKQVPDWRWGLEGEHNHWYPSMRLFRQQRRGDWEGVIERVAAALTIALPGLGRGEG